MDANARQHLFAICSCLPVLSIELGRSFAGSVLQ